MTEIGATQTTPGIGATAIAPRRAEGTPAGTNANFHSSTKARLIQRAQARGMTERGATQTTTGLGATAIAPRRAKGTPAGTHANFHSNSMARLTQRAQAR